jgi:hypothetical protein
LMRKPLLKIRSPSIPRSSCAFSPPSSSDSSSSARALS